MFFTRLMSSIILVIVALITILLGGPVLALTLVTISIIAFFELTKATGIHTKDKSINAVEVVGVIEIIAYYIVVFFIKDTTAICAVIIGGFMGMMFVYVFAFPKFESIQIMSGFFSIIYAPVMLSFIYLTRTLEYGIYIVWMIFISSWICDTCAYLVGVTMGKHKMAPKLSPKKSIEGGIGGIVGSGLLGALFGYFVQNYFAAGQNIIWIFALIGACGAVASQLGDLAASAIKRNHDIKDYGTLIPGHGGIMDRFDSVIVAAPMIYFLAIYLIK